MSFASMAQSSGAAVRAVSELNLLKTENQKRLNVNNTVASARSTELEGTAKEFDDQSKKTIDTFYQKKSADLAARAAAFGFAASMVSLVGGFAAAGLDSSSKGSTGDRWIAAGVSSIGGAFSALGAFFAMMGAYDEAEMLNTQFNELSEETKEDQKNVKALDGNPEI